MRIDAPATVLVTVAFTLLATVSLGLLWRRARLLTRIGLAALVLVLVTGSAGLQLNRMTETYPTWGTLAGLPSPEMHIGERLVSYPVRGPASGLDMTMTVYFPAAYRADPRRRFPVIEALHGFPGTPSTWVRRLDIVRHLDQEIASGRMAPAVVLLPYLTPRRLLDTECTNLVGGPQTETYLTRDVPEWTMAHLRVRADRAAWGLTGYSAGGFCAMNLLLRHPDRYAAAASLSGFADPGIKVGDHSEATTNNVAWRLEHLPRPRVAMWIGWAADDHLARSGSREVVQAAKAPVTVVTAVVPHGGHSHAAWQQMEGPAFDWLSAHLARAE
ncbi:esterase [Actinoplanes sp. SE50]|uniref:alpha/beta hydrolase n=1 Tax=unclassified Actinoplanes TaxID=2626549 RepID=UPI00023EC08E|nr:MULTISPECIES: alpha/beta hydrolase-fold protein [unclassified Actinoplanes]AEV83506.1 uncharacterized protein ACPL_2611 [Actinoplanes sp. SE50/110]ATO82351.1 esterase [Actinoplanes sp. SE50]SLL99758.1 esterase [Actinoplanes sp. SE50/110]